MSSPSVNVFFFPHLSFNVQVSLRATLMLLDLGTRGVVRLRIVQSRNAQ